MRLCLALAILLLPGLAQADTLDELKDDLARQIDSLADDIEGLEDEDEDDGDVRSVARTIDEVTDILGDIERLDGLSRDEQGLVDDYLDDLERVEDALSALEEMKEQAGTIGAFIPDCEEMDRGFTRFLQAVVADPDNDLRDLDDAAGDVAGVAEGLVDEAADVLDDIEGHLRDASGSGLRLREMGAVKSALATAAEATLEYESDELDALVDACEPVIDYTDHPGYEAALESYVAEEEDIESFLEDAEEWLAVNANIGEEICESLRLMRNAYCGLDVEPNESSSVGTYDDLADDAAAAFLRRIEIATRDYDRNLAGRGRNLADRDSLADEMNGRIGRRHAYYERLERSQVLAGSNHPKNRLWRVYGIQQHQLLQQDPDCHVTERAVPGFNGRLRVDCVDISECEVIEFKPDTSSGFDSGARVDDYVRALNAWLETEYRDFANEPVARQNPRSVSDFNDDFVRQAIAHNCLVDGDARFDGHVEAYDPCSRDRDLQCEP